MYGFSSVLIVALLLIALVAAIEIGFRLGRRTSRSVSEPSKAQIGAIQASLLGVLALLLGFTFSLALQRYDSRSEAVVAEANAIGTAMLRAELLPASLRDRAMAALRDYLGLRVDAGSVSLDQAQQRADLLSATGDSQRVIWEIANEVAAESPAPVPTGLFVQALNDMFDAYGARNAALDRHVPEIVLFLLFCTFALTACLVGYASGVARHRATFPTYVLIVLISFLVFIIIDLDRPRRGLIEVSQESLLQLQSDLPARE